MVPTVEVPPAKPFTCQLMMEFEEFSTVAMNWIRPPATTWADAGKTCTTIGAGSLEVGLPATELPPLHEICCARTNSATHLRAIRIFERRFAGADLRTHTGVRIRHETGPRELGISGPLLENGAYFRLSSERERRKTSTSAQQCQCEEKAQSDGASGFSRPECGSDHSVGGWLGRIMFLLELLRDRRRRTLCVYGRCRTAARKNQASFAPRGEAGPWKPSAKELSAQQRRIPPALETLPGLQAAIRGPTASTPGPGRVEARGTWHRKSAAAYRCGKQVHPQGAGSERQPVWLVVLPAHEWAHSTRSVLALCFAISEDRRNNLLRPCCE